MFLFASISIAVIALLFLGIGIATRAEFRKMDEHPEDYPTQYPHKS